MMSPEHVVREYYLEARCQLLEISALLDRYDAACEQSEGEGAAESPPQVEALRGAMAILSKSGHRTDRTEELQRYFAKMVP